MRRVATPSNFKPFGMAIKKANDPLGKRSKRMARKSSCENERVRHGNFDDFSVKGVKLSVCETEENWAGMPHRAKI
jgi:hypothetical protein